MYTGECPPTYKLAGTRLSSYLKANFDSYAGEAIPYRPAFF